MKINLALEEKDRKAICNFLQKLLASTYGLYLKTQNYHWNVTGVQFSSFHALFQSQYEELAESIDEIAERIRALGFYPQGSFSVFAAESLIKDETKFVGPMCMIRQLLNDQETLIVFLRKNLPFVEQLQDGATADFINKRLAVHEKAAWMLRSISQCHQ